MTLAASMAVAHGVAEPRVDDVKGVDNLLYLCSQIGERLPAPRKAGPQKRGAVRPGRRRPSPLWLALP